MPNGEWRMANAKIVGRASVPANAVAAGPCTGRPAGPAPRVCASPLRDDSRARRPAPLRLRAPAFRPGFAPLALLAFALAIPALSFAQAPERVAIKAGRIIPVVGDEIRNGVILIERGKISAIGGKDTEIPFDARLFEFPDKVVFPGLVNVHTWRGMDISNESRPITPQLSAYDAIDPSQLAFEDMLRTGITTVHVIPADDTIIGGMGWIVRPIGMSMAEMTVAEGVALKLSTSPKRGFDRMAHMAMMRSTFAELEDYLQRLAEKRYEEKLEEAGEKIDIGPAEARQRGRDLIRAEDIDDQHRNLLRLAGKIGDLPRPPLDRLGAFINVNNAMDVGPAIKLAKEYDFFDRTVFVLGGEAHKAIDELKKAARPVVLPEDFIYRETDPITGEISEVFVPAKIAEAGLLYAIVPGPDGTLPEREMTYQAARCVRNGIARDEALRAITINPAKMIGMESRVGSLEPGKDANLAVYSGDPLEFTSVVERVFIEGIPAYDRSKDPRLQRLLSPAPGTQPKADEESDESGDSK